jgi:hypothetical protein
VHWFAWYSVCFACANNFCVTSYIISIIFSNVSLSLVSHEEWLRLHVALNRLPLFPFLHCQQCLSMVLSLFQRHMLKFYFRHVIPPFNSPLSYRNFTLFSWSESKNMKNTLVSKHQCPLDCGQTSVWVQSLKELCMHRALLLNEHRIAQVWTLNLPEMHVGQHIGWLPKFLELIKI